MLIEPEVGLRNEELCRERAIGVKFVRDDISIPKSALRGMYGDSEAWKRISCLSFPPTRETSRMPLAGS